MNSLAAIDLNLVLALHALLEEGSVTRAARRMGLSQPAMSHALSRLRGHFGDPLLVRSGRAMVLTVRAAAMLPALRSTVEDLRDLLVPTPLEPATIRALLRLVMDDWMGMALLPRLVARLTSMAPGVELDVLPRGAPGRKVLLRRGAADLAIGQFSGAGMDLRRELLFKDRFVTVMRVGHPVCGTSWDLATFSAQPQIVVSPTGGRRGDVDVALEALGLGRRVVLAVPHFRVALEIVRATDLVLTAPAGLVEGTPGMTLRDPPVVLPPLEVSMLWHARADADPVQRWLRGQVRECVG